MKKPKLLLVALVLGLLLPNVHIHDNACGYDSKTGTGCIYEQVTPLDGGRFDN